MHDNQENLSPHDPLEAQVEVMVSEHLRAKLGPQVGRAAAAFQAELQKQTHARELKRTRRTLYWAVIPAAIAACVAVAATLMTTKQGPTIAQKTGGETIAAAPERNVDSRTYYRDIDGGIQMVADRQSGQTLPMRQIRRQSFSETQWYDPTQNATMSVTVPREDVVYVKVEPF